MTGFAALFVGIFGWWVARNTSEAAAAEGAISAAQQAQADEANEPPPPEIPDAIAGKSYRSESVVQIDRAKKFLDEKAANDPDGRHRRTYAAITRYDYFVLAVALNVRGQISHEQLSDAGSIFKIFRPYGGRGATKPVPEAVYLIIKKAVDFLINPKK